MKLSILLIAGTFSRCQPATRDQQQAITSSVDGGLTTSRHWSMPIYRKNGKTDAEIEIIKPEYRRLSHERNQKLFRLLNSFEHRERRVSSIWHAYTKHLF